MHAVPLPLASPRLAPPTAFQPEGDSVTLLNKMVFTSCTISASFTLGWVFIPLTSTRRHPVTACHSRCRRGTVKWHNEPGQPVGSIRARRVATLSRQDHSIQPKSSRVKTHEWKRLMCTSLHVPRVAGWRAHRGGITVEQRKGNGGERERGGDLFIERQQFFNSYCLCLKCVIFLCKARCCCSVGRYFNA